MADEPVLTFEFVKISDLPKPARGPALDPAVVEALKLSLMARGVIQPPLYVLFPDGGMFLMEGRHRMAACEAAGLTHILVGKIRVEGKEQARLIKLENNLIRVHVKKLDEAEAIKNYHSVQTAISREPREKLSPGRPQGGTSETARRLGKPELTVRGSLKIAGLTSAAKKVAREMNFDDNYGALTSSAGFDDEAKQIASLRSHELKRGSAGARPAPTKAKDSGGSANVVSELAESDARSRAAAPLTGHSADDHEHRPMTPPEQDGGAAGSRAASSTASASEPRALEEALARYRALTPEDRSRFLEETGLVEATLPRSAARDVLAKPGQMAAAVDPVRGILAGFAHGALSIEEAAAKVSPPAGQKT